jgi:hypothetical protein
VGAWLDAPTMAWSDGFLFLPLLAAHGGGAPTDWSWQGDSQCGKGGLAPAMMTHSLIVFALTFVVVVVKKTTTRHPIDARAAGGDGGVVGRRVTDQKMARDEGPN